MNTDSEESKELQETFLVEAEGLGDNVVRPRKKKKKKKKRPTADPLDSDALDAEASRLDRSLNLDSLQYLDKPAKTRSETTSARSDTSSELGVSIKLEPKTGVAKLT